jgi:hypothetical protein
MTENNVVSLRQKDEIEDPLTEILRSGAKRLISSRQVEPIPREVNRTWQVCSFCRQVHPTDRGSHTLTRI